MVSELLRRFIQLAYFTPSPLVFEVFEGGLFFFAYAEGGGLEGHLFARGEPDLRPFRHHTAPPVTLHALPG